SKSMIFTFTNTGNVDIDIEGTDLPASGFTISGLPGTIKAGKSVSVLVTFTPDELRSYSGVFRVFYNYGVEPSEINLIGIGSHEPVAPGITVSPGSGDFGSVNLGESKSMIFTFANTGNADLNIIGTDIPTSGFTVNNLPAIIKTGEVATVFVTFTPSVSRSYSGVFRVFYDSGVGASEINLIGVGNKVVLVPGLSVNPRSNDYGSVILGESKSMLFTFSNTGNTDITIVDYDIPTSGFTVKGLSGTIKPDEDLVALVTFSPEQPRSYSGVLRVFYDSGLSASEISLSGIGVGNVIASIIPPGNINFGNAAVGDRLSANLVFTNKGNVDIQITAIDLPEDAGFTVAGIPALIPAYSTLNAVAIFTPDLPQFYTANLRVLYDHNLATSNIVLSGSGVYDVTDIIEVSEDDIIFGDCNTGESRSANLRFINKGSVPVTITAVDLPAGVFSVEGIPNTIPAYGVLDALVVFTPLFAKNYSAAMRVLYDHGVVTSDINLSGSGIDLSVPAVTVEPQAFSFGRVALGTTRTETLIITNTGNVDFNIIAVDPPDSRFVVSGLTSGSLAEGMSKVAVITFAPDALGDFSSNLRVLFDHDLPPQEITLQGTGIYLDVTPEVLDFPASEIGSSTVFNVTINNSSGLDLEVKSLDVIKTVAFSTEGLKVGDIIRSAGGKRVFQVTFKPTASGAFQDKLNFSVGPVTEAADTVTDVNLLGMYTVLLNGTANADFVVSEIDSFTADIDYKMEISASTNQPGQLFVLFSHDPLSTDKIYALTKNGTLQLFPYGALFGWQNLAYLDSASPGLKLDLSQVDLRPLGCSLCQGQNIDTGANDFKFGNIIITKPDNEVFSNASDFKFLNGTLYIATYINNSATGTSFNFNKGLLEMQSLNIHSLAGTWQVKSMYLGEFKLHPAKLVITEPGDGSISAKWNPQYKNLKIDYSEDSSYYFITFNIGAYNYKYWIKYLPADEFLGFYTCECNGEILEDFTPVCGLREGSSGEWLCKLFEEDDPADPVDTGDQVAQDVIVASFSGSNDMTTRPFKTDGPWELQWEATDRMYINLYEADGDYVASYSQDAAGNSSAYQPDAGEYYMEVKTYNANWKIDIVSIE
ncbi:MAG: choice-of-anchor D domain-containing protein, partial [Deltaproteobacteria bacterium]|nr:choice-of-anchor D domain-containing protein [Deltaproteobacteria bacterium]